MCTSIVRSVTVTPGPIAREISAGRLSTLPCALTSAASRRNSVMVSFIASPSTNAACSSRSIDTGPRLSSLFLAPPTPVRLATAFTRAISTCIEKGLEM